MTYFLECVWQPLRVLLQCKVSSHVMSQYSLWFLIAGYLRTWEICIWLGRLRPEWNPCSTLKAYYVSKITFLKWNMFRIKIKPGKPACNWYRKFIEWEDYFEVLNYSKNIGFCPHGSIGNSKRVSFNFVTDRFCYLMTNQSYVNIDKTV